MKLLISLIRFISVVVICLLVSSSCCKPLHVHVYLYVYYVYIYIYMYLYNVHIHRLQLRFCEHIEGRSVTVKESISFMVFFLLFILTISSDVLCGFWRRVQTIACFVFFLLSFSMSFSFLASFFLYFFPFGCRCILMLLSFFPLGCSFLFMFLSFFPFGCSFLSFRLGVAFFSCFFLSFFLSFCLGVAVQLSLPSFMLSSFFLFPSFCPLGCRFTAVFVRFFLSVWVEPYNISFSSFDLYSRFNACVFFLDACFGCIFMSLGRFVEFNFLMLI